MTTPPIEPPVEPPEPERTSESEEPSPQTDPTSAGAAVAPHDVPALHPATPAPPARYETRTLWVTALITVVVLSGLTLMVPPFGLLAPVTLIVALFFIRRDATPHRRSIVTGIILGSGIGLLTTAGICTALLNGSSGI